MCAWLLFLTLIDPDCAWNSLNARQSTCNSYTDLQRGLGRAGNSAPLLVINAKFQLGIKLRLLQWH